MVVGEESNEILLGKEVYCRDNRRSKTLTTEHLFRSIVYLQIIPGMESAVIKLKKKLEKEFDSVLIEKEKVYKEISYLRYYPNGLVEEHLRWNKILLSPYDFELIEAPKKPARQKRDLSNTLRLAAIKDNYPLWYWQLKNRNHSYFISWDEPEKKKYDTSLAFMMKYDLLIKEAQEYLSDRVVSNNCETIVNGFLPIFQIFVEADILTNNFSGGYYDINNFERDFVTLNFLTEEEMDKIEKICRTNVTKKGILSEVQSFAFAKFSSSYNTPLKSMRDNPSSKDDENEDYEDIRCDIHLRFDINGDRFIRFCRNQGVSEIFKKTFSVLRRVKEESLRKALIAGGIMTEDMFVKEEDKIEDNVIQSTEEER